MWQLRRLEVRACLSSLARGGNEELNKYARDFIFCSELWLGERVSLILCCACTAKMALPSLIGLLMFFTLALAQGPRWRNHHSWDDAHWSSYCARPSSPVLTTTVSIPKLQTVSNADLSQAPATCSATRTTAYSSFSYTVETSTRYATPVPSPLVLTTSYAPAFSEASTLLSADVKYTSYSLDRSLTTLHDGEYGQGAYARLWAPLSYNTSVPFTTTVSPTPVASSELIFPPALYTACPQYTDDCIDCYKLPKDFIWGVAGSAFQIEGGLTEDGRGPSDLDVFGSLPNTEDFANAVVADMNYYLFKTDIARLAAIGIPYYSFSVSWTRVVPFGEVGSPINTPGLEHYDDLINTCIEYGVKPIVTLSHNDAPLNLTYLDPRFADAFLYYAKQVMTRYADRVSHWVTLNGKYERRRCLPRPGPL